MIAFGIVSINELSGCSTIHKRCNGFFLCCICGFNFNFNEVRFFSIAAIMNSLGSNFSHLGQWVLTLESTVRAEVRETSGVCMSWVSISMSSVFSIYRTSKQLHTRGQQRHATHLLSGRKYGGEISSAVDGQSSAGTTSYPASLVSNSALSSLVVSACISNLRGQSVSGRLERGSTKC